MHRSGQVEAHRERRLGLIGGLPPLPPHADQAPEVEQRGGGGGVVPEPGGPKGRGPERVQEVVARCQSRQ